MPVCTLLYGNGGLDSAPKAHFCAVPPQKFDSLRSLRMTDNSGHGSRGESRADPGEQKRADLLCRRLFLLSLYHTSMILTVSRKSRIVPLLGSPFQASSIAVRKVSARSAGSVIFLR